MLGLDDVYLFAAVVENGGVSAAARRLGIAKSTMARRITALETRLGKKLYHRGPKQLVLTNFGAECLLLCQKVVRDADAVFALPDVYSQTPSGSLHVICPPLLGMSFVESFAAKFAMEMPDVRLHLEETTQTLDPRHVSADLVIYAAFAALPDVDVVAKTVYSDDFVLVASPGVFDCGVHPVVPADLVGLDCIGFGRKADEWYWELSNASETVTIPFTPRYSASQMSAVFEAARVGVGIAALPMALCAKDIRQGKLLRVLPNWALPKVSVFAVYPNGNTLTTAGRSFLNLLLTELPKFIDAESDV